MFGLVKQFCHCLAVLLDLIFQYVQVFDIAALYTTLKVGKPRLPHMLEELRLQQAVRTYQPGLAVLFQHRLSLFVGHGDHRPLLLWLTCMIVSRTVLRSAGSLHRLDQRICFSTTGR